MYKYLFLALLLTSPAALYAQPAPDMKSGENVEEPDAPDDDSTMEKSKNEEPKTQEQNAETSTPLPAEKKPEDTMLPGGNTVILQGLNKVTATRSKIEAVIGSTVHFGTLEITAKSCWKSAPDARPENAALLVVTEVKQNEAPTKLFDGWMFSSTPGLSSLENAFYDIAVVKCEKADASKL